MRPVFNPYIAGDPVGKTPAFVGRADVLREVLRVLRHPHQNAIVLYGQRRIGKTSVLQWLEKHLPNEGPYHPVYLDLMNYSGQPLDTLLQNLARAMARALRHPRPVLEGDIQEAFREHFLPRLLDALPAETALVLLMDEFDVQADLDADKEFKKAFFTYMRNLRQVVPRRLQFVFVLGRTIDDLDIVARGLFKDLPAQRVSLLSREDTEDLVRLAERRGSLRWTHPAVETIWDLTHGHPYLVQALCAEVWEALHADGDGDETPRVRKADVEAAVEPVLARSAHMFAWIWEGLGPAEKVAAAALAEAGPGPVSEERLETILAESGVRIVIRELRDAPRQLQEWDILEKSEGGYRFRVELLRRWIAEHHSLDRTQDELDRIHPVADNLYQAARGLYERGDLEGARGNLERALGLNPSHQGALELLGEIALAQDDLDAAQKALESLLEFAPRRALERLVQVYLRRGEEALDEEEERQWYRKALTVMPEHPIARERLERKTRLAGLFQEAKTALEKGSPDAAIPALQEIIALEPTYRDSEAVTLLYQAVSGEDPVALRAEKKQLQSALANCKQEKEREARKRGIETIPPRLSPWNPRDYLRLLFWTIFDRARLAAYRAAYGTNAEKPISSRLAFTLALWPSLWLNLGLGVGLLPRAENGWPAGAHFFLTLTTELVWPFFLIFMDRLEGGRNIASVVSVLVALIAVWGVGGISAILVMLLVCLALTFLGLSVLAKYPQSIKSIKSIKIKINDMWNFWVVFVVDVVILVTVAVANVAGGIVGSMVGGLVGWTVAIIMTVGPPALRTVLGALALFALLLALPFLSLGGWVWLQTGQWPVPVWSW